MSKEDLISQIDQYALLAFEVLIGLGIVLCMLIVFYVLYCYFLPEYLRHYINDALRHDDYDEEIDSKKLGR